MKYHFGIDQDPAALRGTGNCRIYGQDAEGAIIFLFDISLSRGQIKRPPICW
jgi:hypothetical protein